MVDVVMICDDKGGDGTTWRAGNTYSAGESYAKHLIGKGAAYAADYSLPDVPLTTPQVDAVATVVPDSATTAAAALANRTLMQAALDRGRLSILTPGVFYINAPLTIGSETELTLGPYTIIRQRSGTAKNLLQSKAYTRSTTSVTLTWSAGLSCSVAWTAHGRSVGDFVWVRGANQAQFTGVFRITAVADANNFTVQLYRVPQASPTGTVVACLADKNITIRGGTFDYDNANNSGANVDAHCIILGGVAGLRMHSVNSINALKFAFNIGAVYDAKLYGLRSDVTASDGLKIYGPAVNVQVYGFSGRTGDDGVTVQTKEPDAYSAYRWTFGDCLGVRVHDVNVAASNASVSCGIVYLSDNEFADDIEFDGVSGSAPGAAFRVETAMTTGNFGTITIKGLSAVGANALQTRQCVGSMLNLIDFHNNPVAAASGALDFGGTTTIETLNIERMVADTPAAITGPTYCALLSGIFNSVNFINCQIDGNSGTIRGAQVGTASNIREINWVGGSIQGADALVLLPSSVSNTPNISVHGMDLQTLAVINASSSVNCSITGNRINGATNGIVRATGSITVNVKSDGSNLLGTGSWVVIPSGSPSIRAYGWDIAVDPIGLPLASVAGQFFTSTRASAVNQGPSVSMASSFVALGTGASGVNTVIS